jgi:iron complex transport system permease protein
LFVLVCDLLGRIVIFPYELPIELIAGVFGSIVFIGIMFKRLNIGHS